jgi:pimeloyl-ACP methyl ester carboxylesterase
MTSTLNKGDEIIHYSDKMEQAAAKDFDSNNNVIIIHGFTASSIYLETLAKSLANNGFNVFLFNYNSYRGIENAAQSLLGLLKLFDQITNGNLSNNKLTLVCHSMGGLVSRAFIQLMDGAKYCKGIVTLGTPHNGTLHNSEVLEIFLKWGEYVSGVMPYFTPDCVSALELIGKDENKLIRKLNEDLEGLDGIDFLTISGGKPYLHFGHKAWDLMINKAIQNVLETNENDGLVTESSSKLEQKFEHFNEYSDFKDINHSYLIENQFVSLKIAAWINRLT